MAKIIINPHHRRFDFSDKWPIFHWNQQNQTSTRLLDRSVWDRPLPCLPLRLNGTSNATQPPLKTEVTTSRKRQRALTGAVWSGSHPRKPRQHYAVRPPHTGTGVSLTGCCEQKQYLHQLHPVRPRNSPFSEFHKNVLHPPSLSLFLDILTPCDISPLLALSDNVEDCWLCLAGKRERTVLKSTPPIVPHSIYLSEKTGSACELAALPTLQ